MRVLAIVGALVLGMIGLFMSLCGGGFLVMSLATQGAGGIAVIAVPSMLLGGFIIWLCVKILRSMPDE